MLDVTVIGSANLDLVVRTARHPRPGETVLGVGYAEFPGGKGLNQAVAAARAGARVAFVGAVGDDDAGTRLSEVLREDGILDEHVAIVPGVPTGRALITVGESGDNSIVVVPGANAHVRPACPDSRVLVAQLEIPHDVVTAAFEAASVAGARTVLDPAPAAELPPELLRRVDVIVPNEHESEQLGGAAALLAAGVGTVIVTQGARGARVSTVGPDGRIDSSTVPAPRVDAVDTTGAGDAFCGTLAARLAAGDPMPSAVRWAVAAGALATTTDGAVPSIPDRADIARVLDSTPPS